MFGLQGSHSVSASGEFNSGCVLGVLRAFQIRGTPELENRDIRRDLTKPTYKSL